MNKFFIFSIVVILTLGMISCNSNKSELLIKDWKATDITLGDTKLSAADIGGVSLSIKPDSTFVYTETGISQQGKWKLNDESTQLELTYKDDPRKINQSIEELSKDKLIVKYEEHGMKRSLVLIPDTK